MPLAKNNYSQVTIPPKAYSIFYSKVTKQKNKKKLMTKN